MRRPDRSAFTVMLSPSKVLVCLSALLEAGVRRKRRCRRTFDSPMRGFHTVWLINVDLDRLLVFLNSCVICKEAAAWFNG